jgi:ferritin-like protein
MKRTATEWADLIDCTGESSNLSLCGEEATELAELLRAMAAERETMYLYWWLNQNGAGPTNEEIHSAILARRRAEGVGGE